MEIVIFAVCAVTALSCLSANLLIAYLLWQHWHDKKTPAQQPAVPEETPEEREARRLAAKAQMAYEQGFVNLMEYSGKPPKKESDLI